MNDAPAVVGYLLLLLVGMYMVYMVMHRPEPQPIQRTVADLLVDGGKTVKNS